MVGVVKNYVEGSAYDEIPPTLIMGPGSWFTVMHIKFNPALSTSDALANAEMVFKKYNPAYPFDYKFIDQQYANNLTTNNVQKQWQGYLQPYPYLFHVLVYLACHAYVAESRTKEIGVRKVLGAISI